MNPFHPFHPFQPALDERFLDRHNEIQTILDRLGNGASTAMVGNPLENPPCSSVWKALLSSNPPALTPTNTRLFSSILS
ncbi:MAG: hypothetical protein ACE5GO_05340 [Anaerolineales bacterium]